MPLEFPDQQHLEAAEGYLELGLDADAWEKLEEIQPELRTHPKVLKLRTKILMNCERWELALEVANARCNYKNAPTDAFIDVAYCLHRFKRTAEAREKLLAAPADKWGIALWHYNMACYECSLGHIDSAKFHLQLAFKKNPDYRLEALADCDLEPLWNDLNAKEYE